MLPGIYCIRCIKLENTPYYRLEYNYPRFELPKIIYGDVMSNMVKVWNEYAITGKTTGVILTGTSGNSKTLSGQILSNIAIDNDLPVVMVTEIEVTIELISFISSLRNCVIFLDEFKKNTPYNIESRTLTMFSDLANTRKLFIITENDKFDISMYIRNRPGRFRYHYEFNKISKSVFDDYVSKNKTTDEFKIELTKRYTRATNFSFDYLQAIISEHQHYPNEKLDDILERLNIDDLGANRVFKIREIVNIQTNQKVDVFVVSTLDMSETSIKRGNNIYIDLFKNNVVDHSDRQKACDREISTNFRLFVKSITDDSTYNATSKDGLYRLTISLDEVQN